MLNFKARLYSYFLALGLITAFAAPQAKAQMALGFADTTYIAGGQSASALFSSNDDWLQTIFTINGTRGNFYFAVGGIYKFTIAGNARAGFHVGPGVTLGTVPTGTGSEFGFSLVGLAGGHFTLFERLILSVDGGPQLSVVDGNTDFRLKPMGELLGLSVHYLF